MPPPMIRERTSIPSITTPIPPSHWVKERHSRRPRGCALMQSTVVPGMQFGLIEWERTVAPEVVKPDMDSNHELTNPRRTSMRRASSTNGPTNTPPNQYGKAPMRTVSGQTNPTPTKASRSRRRWAESVRVNSPSIAAPKPPLISMAGKKACKANSQPSSHAVISPQMPKGTSRANKVHPRMRLSTS